MLTRNLVISAFSLFIIAFIFGCSNGSSPITLPNEEDTSSLSPATQSVAENQSNRHLWGLWEIQIDAITGAHEIIPLRTVEWHVNCITFLERSGTSTIKLSDVLVDGSYVDVNVGLTHPFPGLNQYCGFDVRGIFIGDGSFDEFASDGDLVMAEGDEPRLYNADGWTRWWNPSEFPIPNVLGYMDGIYGTKNDQVHYRTTLNGYKYFSDDLALFEDFPIDLEFDQRGLFKAASVVNWRHYSINFGDQANRYIFNYAVDASHKLSDDYDGSSIPPLSIIPDPFFELDANQPEAFAITVEPMFNSLYYKDDVENGGDIIFAINIFDWQGYEDPEGIPGQIAEVRFESPSLVGSEIKTIALPFESGDHYSTYLADFTICHPDANDYQDILISIVSLGGSYEIGYDGYDTDYRGSKPEIIAYYLYTPYVDTEVPVQAEYINLNSPNGGEVWLSGATENISWYATEGISFVKVEYSSNGGSAWEPIDGGTGIMSADATPYAWDIPLSLASPNMLVKVSDAGPDELAEDQSDALFAIESLTLDFPTSAGDDFQIDIPGQDIEWTIGSGTTNVVTNLYIEFSKNGGGNWEYLNGGLPVPAGPGSWEWTPDINDITTQGRIRITDNVYPVLTDTSDENFEVFDKHELTLPEYEDYYQGGTYTYRGRYSGSLSGLNQSYYNGTVTDWDFTASPFTIYLGGANFYVATTSGSGIPRIASAPAWSSTDRAMRTTIGGTASRRAWWVFRFVTSTDRLYPRGSTYYADATFTDINFPGICIDYIACNMTEQFGQSSTNDITFPLDVDSPTLGLDGSGYLYWVNKNVFCTPFDDQWAVNMNGSQFEVIAEGSVKVPHGGGTTYDHCLLIKLMLDIGPTTQIVHTGQMMYQWVNMDDGMVLAFMQTHNEGNSTAGVPYTVGFTGDQVNRGIIGAWN